jgi:hypothetical protein
MAHNNDRINGRAKLETTSCIEVTDNLSLVLKEKISKLTKTNDDLYQENQRLK